MEAARLYVVASTLGVRAGGVMLVFGHPDQRPMTHAEAARCDMGLLLRAAVAGVSLLIERDRAATPPTT